MRPFQRRSAIRTRYGSVFGRPRALGGCPVCPALLGLPGTARTTTRYRYRYGLGDVDATFNPSVEDWRDLVSSMAGDIPVNFILAWFQRESNGNPCSWTSLQEAGVSQLMYPDNIATAGTTLAAQHPVPPCVAGRETTAYFSSLTADQAAEQVRAAVQYINAMRSVAHAKLDAAGVDWPETSAGFWSIVKLQHAYPGPTAVWLTSATQQLGHPPEDWAEFRSTINGYASVLNNAEWVGSYGEGGGSLLGGSNLLVLGALGLGLLYLWSRSR